MQQYSVILQSLEHIISNESSKDQQIDELFQLLNVIAIEATKDDVISFTSLFSRLSYLSQKISLPKKEQFFLHHFRIKYERSSITDELLSNYVQLGQICLNNLIEYCWNNGQNIKSYNKQIIDKISQRSDKVKSFYPLLEVLILEIDLKAKEITFVQNDRPATKETAKFDIPHINELFTRNILNLEKIFGLPLASNFIDCEVNENNIFHPKAIVIDPDYLIDVTSVANNSYSDDKKIWLANTTKFLPKPSSKYILIGNVANYIMDRLVASKDITLNQIYQEVFKLYPIEFSKIEDVELSKIISNIKSHFNHLKRIISTELEQHNIYMENVYLEPSFFCRDYGLQGRLDLLHLEKEENNASIIELKSGSPFMANSYGISKSHYIQTILYDMIISSVYGGKVNTKNFILYSKLDKDNLKYAPKTKHQLYETLKVRNDLISMERAFAKSPQMVENMVDTLRTSTFSDVKGFKWDELKQLEKVYQSAAKIERSYFNHFVYFVANEALLAKLGEHGVQNSNGLASLWLETQKEKEDQFRIFNHLRILTNQSDQEVPIIVFKRSQYTVELSSFRKGDIAVLYPNHFKTKNILRNQIFKCSILSIGKEDIQVRLRSSQYNQQIFKDTEFWNLEPDTLGNSFTQMNRGLFSFLNSPEDKKQVLLGLQRPNSYDQIIDIEVEESMTPEQKSIVYKAFASKDYFLIWGPPGTGKTSVVLKNLVASLYKYTSESILLLAYTNRAVDEICEALNNAELQDNYIRLGSRFSIGDEHRSTLLFEKIEDKKNRNEIKSLLQKNRIFVSTVSSINGKLEILDLIQVDTVIVDEASQILEPMLIGLLPKFNRFIMIGDHKQLPAVVVQKEKKSIIDDKELNSIDIKDMRMSLFERLFQRCKSQNWTNAWSILSHQGRMHKDIMRPVNDLFYEKKLKLIPSLKRLDKPFKLASAIHSSTSPLFTERLIYVPTETDSNLNWKTNQHEADVVGYIIDQIKKSTSNSDSSEEDLSIGIITPYRAQIALLKQTIEDDQISIDTVERYQGGARDIIIISLCTNRISQLESLISLSSEGIDRKLNVALTRAKEQIILIGNQNILLNDSTYKQLLDYFSLWELKLESSQ